MINTLLGVLFSLFFGTMVLYLIKANGNPNKLTIRGKRVVFVLAIIGGFFIHLFATHFYIDCDLRPNATTTECKVNWF